MRRCFQLCALFALLSSCGPNMGGELVGVEGRRSTPETPPFEMVFVPDGSYTQGVGDEDVSYAMSATTKTITVEGFWMDQTEITNNKYRQFVNYVIDSISKVMLINGGMDEFGISEDPETGDPIDPPVINKREQIDPRSEDQKEILKDLYYQGDETFYRRKEIDTRKLNYEYFWYDIAQAANKKNRYNFDKQKYEGSITKADGKVEPIRNRGSFIMRDVVNIYPDTLCWSADFSYSYNDPTTSTYFWQPSYDEYPVVGVTWKQAYAFCIWRSNYLRDFLVEQGESPVNDYRLPTEAEWEYAARGGYDLNMYPWGNYYTRNQQGCFIANFKPLRGNYSDDGGVKTIAVASFDPNDYGLYDMAGNVAEWTMDAYDESAYKLSHDLNPSYQYNAKPNDKPARKRKCVRGGSWKDVNLFLQASTRTYEYQDTARSYIGFRCVRSLMGGN